MRLAVSAESIPAGKKNGDLGMKSPMPGRVQTFFFSVINVFNINPPRRIRGFNAHSIITPNYTSCITIAT